MALTLPSLLDRMADQEAERVRAAQAASPRQADCNVCGLVEAGCFGFGSFRDRRGIWACQDIDCRAEAEARWRAAGRTLEAAE